MGEETSGIVTSSYVSTSGFSMSTRKGQFPVQPKELRQIMEQPKESPSPDKKELSDLSFSDHHGTGDNYPDYPMSDLLDKVHCFDGKVAAIKRGSQRRGTRRSKMKNDS